MSPSLPNSYEQGLEDLLNPVRDQYLIAFLTAIRRVRQMDTALDVEPVTKSFGGKIGRSGPLNLPARTDGTLQGGGAPLDVLEPQALMDCQSRLVIGKTLTCDVLPFIWGDVWLFCAPACSSALMMRLRLWYLDWFQTRIVEPTETLQGAVHRLDGPHEHDGGHWFHLDLGTAPVDAVVTLLELLATGQVRVCSLGARPDFA